MNLNLLEFTKNELINFSQIDKQHKEIVACVNKLYDCYSKSDHRGFIALLDNFITTGTDHFHTEEKFMLNNNYPNFYSHKIEHDRFTRKISKYRDQFIDNPEDVGNTLLLFVKNWFIKHMAGKDKMLGGFLAKRKAENKLIGV